ncbi:MAG: DUF2695 domain-containing protein [Deltaproteobacteria bacterium]|nr:DUF2695 domain-containing protein [Deltaproteobacteria bacterium]
MTSPRLSDDDLRELRRLDELCGLRRHDEALPGLAALVERNPAHGVSVFLYTKALRVTGGARLAGEVLARAARLSPGDPHVGLGLAWAARDAGDHARAVALSRPALEVASLRGEALAIGAREREVAGAPEQARALYLESYEALPMLDVLAACERLSGIEPASGGSPAPWPIGFVMRAWLFRALELELVARSRARFGDLPADRALTAGCDHGAALTARWADRAGVDRVSLYRALSDRGGFCDCEVVLNASREDDDEGSVLLVTGRVEGAIPARLAEDFFDEGTPAAPVLAESPKADRDRETTRAQAFLAQQTAAGRAIAPQLALDVLVADLAISCGALPRTTLVVVAPDRLDAALVPAAELVVMEGGRVVTSPLTRPPQQELVAALPWIGPALASLDAVLPERAIEPVAARHELGDERAARLLAVGDERGVLLTLDQPHAPALAVPASLVRSSDGTQSAWLVASRTRRDLFLEDRSRGTWRRLLTGRFGGRLAFDHDGRSLFAVLDGSVVSIDLASGARSVLVKGDDFALSPDAEWLAVERAGRLALVERCGRMHGSAFEGRMPRWSPREGRLAFLARPAASSSRARAQVHVLERGAAGPRRIGPTVEEACWPSFADDGRSLVFQARVARRQSALEGDKVRIDDSERLFLVALEADEPPRVLHATEGGTLRISSPLAHPHLPIVAFRTDDDPIAGQRRSGQRLSIVDIAGGSPPRTWIERPHTPIAWLT